MWIEQVIPETVIRKFRQLGNTDTVLASNRFILLPQSFIDLIFMPKRRSRRRPKKALYKRLLARSRKAQKNIPSIDFS